MRILGATSWLNNTRGNITITTSIVGLMLATAVGASLDGSRLFTTHQSLQSITDAAALAAAMPEDISNSKRIEIAKGSISNQASSLSQYKKLKESIDVKGTGEQVYVSLSAEVPMLFGGVLGSDSRRVSVSSLAEETVTRSIPATSLTFVLDLSSSMADRFDSGSKSAAVRASITDALKDLESSLGGPDLAELNLSAGMYGFNWGAVKNETVALEPGVTTVIDSLVNVTLSEGSVPSASIEAALKDHITEKENIGGRERFLVYITDGGVDNEKADEPGQHLEEQDLFSENGAARCPKTSDRLETTKQRLANHYNEFISAQGLLGKLQPLTANSEELIIRAQALQGTTGSRRIDIWINKYNIALDRIRQSCDYVQTERVLDACETAREEEDISVIAVNMAPEDEEAVNVTKACIFGEDRNKKGKKRKRNNTNLADGTKTQKLPNGLTIQLSDDEQSVYAEVNTLDDLRHVFATMMPEGTSRRSVRLVN